MVSGTRNSRCGELEENCSGAVVVVVVVGECDGRSFRHMFYVFLLHVLLQMMGHGRL